MRTVAPLYLVLLTAIACQGSPGPDTEGGIDTIEGTGGFDAAAIAQVDATTDLPASARAVLENADSFEILSTETARGESDGDLTATHILDYAIRGRTTVEDTPTQHGILDNLYAAFRENDSMAARCFIPRHAIVATRGDERVLLVICFECMQWRGVGPNGAFNGLLGKSTRDAINAIWTAHGLQLAK